MDGLELMIDVSNLFSGLTSNGWSWCWQRSNARDVRRWLVDVSCLWWQRIWLSLLGVQLWRLQGVPDKTSLVCHFWHV